MKYLGEGVYAYNLPDDFKTARVIFNDGASQYPAAQQAGLEFTKESVNGIYQWQLDKGREADI